MQSYLFIQIANGVYVADIQEKVCPKTLKTMKRLKKQNIVLNVYCARVGLCPH